MSVVKCREKCIQLDLYIQIYKSKNNGGVVNLKKCRHYIPKSCCSLCLCTFFSVACNSSCLFFLVYGSVPINSQPLLIIDHLSQTREENKSRFYIVLLSHSRKVSKSESEGCEKSLKGSKICIWTRSFSEKLYIRKLNITCLEL